MKLRITSAIFSLLVFSTVANAQIQQGTILLGGGIGYNSTTSDQPAKPESNAFSLNLSAGKAIRNNTVVGLVFSYSHNLESNPLDSNTFYKTKINGFNAGIFYRKYKALGKHTYLFGEAQGRFGISQFITEYPTYTDKPGKTYSASVGLGPGFAYQLSKKIQLEVTVPDFVNLTYERNKAAKTKSFSVSTSLPTFNLYGVDFGFRWLL